MLSIKNLMRIYRKTKSIEFKMKPQELPLFLPFYFQKVRLASTRFIGN